MDELLKMSTREEAIAAIRARHGAWGAELIVKEIAWKTQEVNQQFNRSALERQRVWNWLHDLLPRGR